MVRLAHALSNCSKGAARYCFAVTGLTLWLVFTDRVLSNDTETTIFAPVDQAFANFLTVYDLSMEDMLGSADLANVMKYHMVASAATTAQMQEGAILQTMYGERLALLPSWSGFVRVLIINGATRLNDGVATIIQGDIAVGKVLARWQCLLHSAVVCQHSLNLACW